MKNDKEKIEYAYSHAEAQSMGTLLAVIIFIAFLVYRYFTE